MTRAFDYEKIHNELESYLESWAQYYDLGEVMAELREYTADDGGCIQSLDDVDHDDFQDILKRWDRTNNDNAEETTMSNTSVRPNFARHDSSIPEADRARIYELADEYGVHPSIVRSLYDIMPNELYDGIPTALEDYADMTDDTSAMTEDDAWDALLYSSTARD